MSLPASIQENLTLPLWLKVCSNLSPVQTQSPSNCVDRSFSMLSLCWTQMEWWQATTEPVFLAKTSTAPSTKLENLHFHKHFTYYNWPKIWKEGTKNGSASTSTFTGTRWRKMYLCMGQILASSTQITKPVENCLVSSQQLLLPSDITPAFFASPPKRLPQEGPFSIEFSTSPSLTLFNHPMDSTTIQIHAQNCHLLLRSGNKLESAYVKRSPSSNWTKNWEERESLSLFYSLSNKKTQMMRFLREKATLSHKTRTSHRRSCWKCNAKYLENSHHLKQSSFSPPPKTNSKRWTAKRYQDKASEKKNRMSSYLPLTLSTARPFSQTATAKNKASNRKD